jgi:MFS family permease
MKRPPRLADDHGQRGPEHPVRPRPYGGAGVADEAQVRKATRAVYIAFAGAGFAYASWASRIPQVRAELRVTPGTLGLILLCGAIGSGTATPLSGLVVGRIGEARAVAVMSLISAVGLATIAVGYSHIAAVATGLFFFGFGSGAWDVAMNVQGAAVERGHDHAIMPKFHAGWSLGTVAGAGAGAAMVALGVPVTAHLLAVALAVSVAVPASTRGFLPRGSARLDEAVARHRRGPRRGRGLRRGGDPERGPMRGQLAAWTERRTLLIGLFVLCMAFSEGTGNDWLSLSVIDGYHIAAFLGDLVFAVFLTAMTAGRWFGPRLIDRYGRVAALRASAATALAGLLLIDFGVVLPVAAAGAALMGLGTALGFPVGMSAAADDPRYAAARVSTTASLGYLAFLAGPPTIGFLADQVGVLHALSAAGVLIALAFFLSPAAAPIAPGLD